MSALQLATDHSLVAVRIVSVGVMAPWIRIWVRNEKGVWVAKIEWPERMHPQIMTFCVFPSGL